MVWTERPGKSCIFLAQQAKLWLTALSCSFPSCVSSMPVSSFPSSGFTKLCYNNEAAALPAFFQRSFTTWVVRHHSYCSFLKPGRDARDGAAEHDGALQNGLWLQRLGSVARCMTTHQLPCWNCSPCSCFLGFLLPRDASSGCNFFRFLFIKSLFHPRVLCLLSFPTCESGVCSEVLICSSRQC